MHLSRTMARLGTAFTAVGLLLGVPLAASAQVVYNGTTNAGIVFGVTNYGGGPNNGAPTYILDNQTGRNDILASPAGGFQTANPVVANNIVSYGPNVFGPGQYMFGVQAGGGNANGNFGTGGVVNYGSQIAFSLADSAPGGGSASYTIAGWTANYTAGAVIPAGTTYGNVLGIAGTLQAVNSAVAIAMRTYISSPNAGDPFFGGVDLPQLVLAFAGNHNGNALGGPGGNTAGLVFNGLSYSGLAVNSIALGAAIPAGDVLNITTTLTVIADPADIGGLDPTLIPLDGGPLWDAAGDPSFPSLNFETTSVPEPGSLALLGLAGAGLTAWRRKRKLLAA